MCSRQFSCTKLFNVRLTYFIFINLLLLSLFFSASAPADEGRYPENLVWRLITENELKKLTGCHEEFREREHSAPPLFEEPDMPFGEIQSEKNTSLIVRPAPPTWELPPFYTIGVPNDEKKKSEAARKAEPVPSGFAEISARTEELPDASLQPLPRRANLNFSAPDSALPSPFSLRRYHTKTKGFFHIAAYGGQGDSLFAERYYNTLKLAAPNRTPIEGFGQKAFISFLPSLQSQSPDSLPEFDIETAQGNLSFVDIAPKGEARPDELNPGIIKARQAPSFSSIPSESNLPEGFENEVRRQLVRLRYQNLLTHKSRADIPAEYAGNGSAGAAPAKAGLNVGEPSAAPREAEAPDAEDGEYFGSDDGEPGSLGGFRDAAAEKELNPFATRTDLMQNPDGLYVMIIYYPQQSLVCELAIDTRCCDLQAFFNIAMLVQARMQRW